MTFDGRVSARMIRNNKKHYGSEKYLLYKEINQIIH